MDEEESKSVGGMRRREEERQRPHALKFAFAVLKPTRLLKTGIDANLHQIIVKTQRERRKMMKGERGKTATHSSDSPALPELPTPRAELWCFCEPSSLFPERP